MASPRKFIVWLTVPLLCGAIFAGAGQVLFNASVTKLNIRQLQDYNAAIIRRAELAADYGFIALGQLVEKGATGCDDEALNEVRRGVYSRGAVKDIRVVDAGGRVACSAFAETQEFDTVVQSPEAKVAAQTAHIQLFAVPQRDGISLGIEWDITSELSLVAIVNLDSLLFDVLPEELREQSLVKVTLKNGQTVARHASDGAASPSPARTFARASERYPFSASIDVPSDIFANWNRSAEGPALLAALLLGLLFGALLGKVLTRPKDALSEIDLGLANQEFRAFLQPIFSLSTGEITGCEVLARRVRSDNTIIMPSRFIAVAEDGKRIRALTHQVMSDALRHLKPWMRSHRTFKVNINVSPSDLLEDGFVESWREAVRRAGVSPRQIVVEVTEREELGDLERAAMVVSELRELAFRVAIDDAGTGHSGLSYVQKLGANTIKIDKFFVDSIGSDPTAQAVVEMLVGLARQLNMTTVAEGIETEKQVSALRSCGVDEGQGYIVAPPLPPAVFIEQLARDARPPAADVPAPYAGAA